MTLFTIRRYHRSRRAGEEGLTLIELLIVVTIIGILAAIVSVSVGGVTTTTNQKARQSKIQGVQSSVDAYRLGESKQGGTIAAFPVEDTPGKKCNTDSGAGGDIDGSVTAWYGLDGSILGVGTSGLTPAAGTVKSPVDGADVLICDVAANNLVVRLVNVPDTGGLAQKGYFRANASTTSALSGSGNKGFWCAYDPSTPLGNTGPQSSTGVGTATGPTASMGKVVACTDNLTLR